MFKDEIDLKDQVRQFTGYTSTAALSDDDLDTAYRNAKRRIRRVKNLKPDFIFYEAEKLAAQDALYYWTCLYCKIETGELDSQSLQIGAVNETNLDAKVTQWYRDAQNAMDSIKASNMVQSTGVARSGREYTAGTFDTDTGSGSGGSGSNVTSDDL